MKQHFYENMDEWASFLGKTGTFILEEKLTSFYDAYLSINAGGCGCNKKKRIVLATEKYLDMVNLSMDTKAALRAGLEVNEVVLKHEGNIFATF